MFCKNVVLRLIWAVYHTAQATAFVCAFHPIITHPCVEIHKMQVQITKECDKCFKVRELLQKISIYKLTEVLTCALHSFKKFRNTGFSSREDYSNT